MFSSLLFSSLLFVQPKQFQVKSQSKEKATTDVNRISIHPEDMKVLLDSHSLPLEENRCGCISATGIDIRKVFAGGSKKIRELFRCRTQALGGNGYYDTRFFTKEYEKVRK
jgi:hypothetical protein